MQLLTDAFDIRPNALGKHILEYRYLQRLATGEFESPMRMFRRVAQNLADAEKLIDRSATDAAVGGVAGSFFELMTSSKFLPNAPTLLGAGGPSQQLHACFVLPLEDSIESIFTCIKEAAIVHSKGSGTGYSLARIRPRGSAIRTGGVSTGAVSFLSVFDAETEVVKNGGTGWGANMAVMPCDHPDILEFIDAKARPNTLLNFNISVGITDDFMECARTDSSFALTDPATGAVVRRLPAREILRRVCRAAWSSGEPGVLFLDRIERDNPTPLLGRIEATNPCAEAPLLPYEACCLGGLNVAEHLAPDHSSFDFEEISRTCRVALRMMDNTFEASKFPLPAIREATLRTRKVGIGVMGFADALVKLGVPYGSPGAALLADKLMEHIHASLTEATLELGEERGAFPAFPQSKYAEGKPRRNATTTANAPNSTISAIAGCSAGVEPFFAIAFTKNLANGERVTSINREFLRQSERLGICNDEFMSRLLQRGSCRDISEIPDSTRELWATAHELDPDCHVRVQAAFQRHTELGVAKTINFPSDASLEDVETAFVKAYELGCKGIACYRDQTRTTNFLDIGAQCPDCVE